jgi:hypothetical protein
MAGYVGRGQPVAVEDNSVETADIIDGAVTNTKVASNAITDDKINSVIIDKAVLDISDNELLALAGL